MTLDLKWEREFIYTIPQSVTQPLIQRTLPDRLSSVGIWVNEDSDENPALKVACSLRERTWLWAKLGSLSPCATDGSKTNQIKARTSVLVNYTYYLTKPFPSPLPSPCACLFCPGQVENW